MRGRDGPAPGGAAGPAVTVVAAVGRRPDLWWTALGALRRLAVTGWWRRPPHLPLPDRQLWGFRMVTAYGRPDAVPDPDDVVSYLEWCRTTAPRRWPASGGAFARRSGPSNHPGPQSG
jgi:hypothetical protein